MRNLDQTFKLILIIGFILSATLAHAQYTPLTGTKICLDPGHGGHDSNDRQTDLGVGTLYYESDATWEAVGYLDSLLQKLGADVKITRITNDPDSPDRDPSLSDRVQVANAFGADYFHSFHTNGAENQDANYSLVLYAGPEDGNADSPEALTMAELMDDEIHKFMRTTATYARADIPFTGYTNGLGVLNNLNMPGTLSEVSFHSNIDEGRRLLNSSYRKAAAWGIVKSFLKFYDKALLETGELGGVITDIDGNALNDIEVTFSLGTADEKVYTGDQFLNGFYFFDRLEPGEYDVQFDKFGYDAQIKTVTIEEGAYTEIDASLTETGGAPSVPLLTSISNPRTGTGVSATWEQNPEITLLGYRLYYATDDSQESWMLAADESDLTATTNSIEITSSDDFKVVPQSDVYHFKLTAVAESGAESDAGDIYSRSSNSTDDTILIVDGFDRTGGSYTNDTHDFATAYFTAIRDSRIATVNTATNEAVTSDIVNLNDYQMIVWFLGDESTVDETFSDAEQAKLIPYLDNGGKLFVSGSEIGWDLGNKGATTDREFFNNYLKASYVGDGASDYSPATGVAESPFKGITVEFGITYPEDYPDDIAPTENAISILDYAVAGKTAGVAYKGTFGEGSTEGGVVTISFPLETAAPTDQLRMMKEVLSYLDIGSFFPIPPAQPTLQLVSRTETEVAAEWVQNTETALIGYRLYYATDDALTDWKLVADEQTLDETSSGIALTQLSDFIDVPEGGVYHFRLTAISEGGFESTPSDTYSAVGTTSDINTLIVDGFDRSAGSYSSLRHTFATSYFGGLIETEAMNITTVANEKLLDETLTLSDYDMVFWFLGDESTSKETFSISEQELLQAYLEGGGSLFVSGSEVGWDLFAKGTDEDKLFYNNYLKATYVADGGAGRSPATGVADTDFSGLEIEFGITYPEDYPDDIDANEGSFAILQYATETYGGIAYNGVFGESTTPGNVIYFSFPLETAEADDISMTLDKVVTYFMPDEEPPANPPVAVNDDATTEMNSAGVIDVLSNDTDPEDDIDPSSLAIVDQPANGTIVIANQKVTYTPTADFIGDDSFTYTISDITELTSEKATVSITVTGDNVTAIDPSIDGKSINAIIYPNPDREQNVTLEIILAKAGDREFDVFIADYSGKVVSQQTYTASTGKNIIELESASLKSGLYFIQISNQGKTTTLKLIKE